MLEAKSLGIPLRQPGTGRPPVRRCSISHLTDRDPDSAETGTVWSCSRCRRTVVDPPRSTKAPSTAPVQLHKTTSPFKDMFRMSNIFSRKTKDDTRSKVTAKQPLTLPRGQSHVARSCDVCGEADVTSSPCSRRHADMSSGGGCSRYKRSASTPRPAGDTRLQLHSALESTASRSARRKFTPHFTLITHHCHLSVFTWHRLVVETRQLHV